MAQAISLFSGCGGCSLGLKWAGLDVRLAVDMDASACQTYAANLGSDTVWQANLSAVSPQEVWERARLTTPNVDLIVGGPPCQGFSSAGARDWQDPRNRLLRHFVEIVTALKPTWFIMENVEGLLTASNGGVFIEAIVRFLEAGYWVRAEKVYMERYGLPQRRKRVIVVGNLEQCAFTFPAPLYHDRSRHSLFDWHPQLSILDAIGDLPKPSVAGAVAYDQRPANGYQARMRCSDGKLVTCHTVKQVNELTRERIRLLAPGATMKALPDYLQQPSFAKRAFRRVMDGTATEKRGGAPAGLKRLVGSAPSLTITSAAPTEFVHPLEDRLLTLRECARIQSFPDWYTFYGSWSSIATQIGNAIPPLFMYQLAGQIRRVARWQPIQRSPGRWLGIAATRSTGLSPALSEMLRVLEDRTHVYTR